MHIEHIAIWTKDLEKMKSFYCSYFNAIAGDKYVNEKKHFQSYFLSFEKGPRLELMQMVGIPSTQNDIYNQFTGLIHFAVSVGSEEKVTALTNRLIKDGFVLIDRPRWTGDGYYESVVLDPEQNRIEITI
ncbi:MAG: VOC family protein [Sphingobacteriales bacterium]